MLQAMIRRLSRREVIFGIFLLLIVVLVAWYTLRVVERQQLAESAVVADLFGTGESEARFATLDGNTLDLRNYLGQPLYIATWASWSPLSRDELIALNAVANEYRDQDITFIALNRKESKEQAERWLATLPPLESLVIVIDTEDYFYNQIGGYAMPETVLYNAMGDRVVHERRPLNESEIRAHVVSVIEPAP